MKLSSNTITPREMVRYLRMNYAPWDGNHNAVNRPLLVSDGAAGIPCGTDLTEPSDFAGASKPSGLIDFNRPQLGRNELCLGRFLS